jgi:hypothetical protein
MGQAARNLFLRLECWKRWLVSLKNLLLPLVTIKAGYSKVPLSDVPRTWLWIRKPHHWDDFVIQIPYPGIGDHLFYSPLPKLLVTQGLAKRVWISEKSRMRSDEMKNIIWESNPFIEGFTTNTGWHNSGLRPIGGNFLDGLVFQFSGQTPALRSTRPQLYWPHELPERGTYWIWDFNRVANRHRIDPDQISIHLQKNTSEQNEIFCYESEFSIRIIENTPQFMNMKRNNRLHLLPREIHLGDYFRRIQKASRFFGLYSGGAIIAAAYQVPSTTFCEYHDPTISFLGEDYVLCPVR